MNEKFAKIDRCNVLFNVGSTIADNRIKQQNFVTAREYHNNSITEKRRRTEVDAEEPARKKIQIVASIATKNEHTKITKVQDEVVKSVKIENSVGQRCLSGDVGQILKFKKAFASLNALYEVYGKKEDSKFHVPILQIFQYFQNSERVQSGWIERWTQNRSIEK